MLTEALFSAVAEAVFGYLLQESNLADRVRAVLGHAPERKAFQTALARAYAAFARQYPDLTAALFDETFLTSQPATELLAQLLARCGHPDPADPDRWDRLPEVTRAAADFPARLEAELAGQPAARVASVAGRTNSTDPKPQWAVPLALGSSQAMDYRFHPQAAQHLPTPSKFWVITRGW